MNLILATVTLLSVAFADLTSNDYDQKLTCYESNGWKKSIEVDPEKEHCSSRCYYAAGKSLLQIRLNIRSPSQINTTILSKI